MKLWRIAAETRKYSADDMSGAGAAARPGRWNDDAQPVIYASPTIAMAVLETAAHVDDAGLPLNRFLIQIEVPDDAWKAREDLDPTKLPPAWAAIPAGRASVRIGSDWLTSARTLILAVPSVIVPEERAALVNPAHPDMRKLTATVVRSFAYNALFRNH